MSSIRKSIFFNQSHTLDRLCALTDGVYAIVLTLLVLDLKIPDTPGLGEAKIIDDLVTQLPNFFSYVISFFVVATLWIKHHFVIKPLQKCNTITLGLNLVHLLFMTLTPYTASLFGHYKEDPIVVLLFSGSIGLAAFSLHILHWYVVAEPEWVRGRCPGRVEASQLAGCLPCHYDFVAFDVPSLYQRHRRHTCLGHASSIFRSIHTFFSRTNIITGHK